MLNVFIWLFYFCAWQAGDLIQEALKEYDAQVAAMLEDFAKIPANPEDKEWVKKKLAHMVEVDQYMRNFAINSGNQSMSKEQKQEFMKAFVSRWKKIDEENTRDLKELLKKYSWFTISEFGAQADNNAWLLVQHADEDKEFQKQVLKLLEALLSKQETSSSNFAYLYDRVASGEGRPQRYGTQGTCVGPGAWEPFPLEDPEQVDVLRAALGLPPLAEYKQFFKNLCK